MNVRGLSKRFPVLSGVWQRPRGFVQALSEVSFTLERGDILAVVGGSGSGKSTLARILCRLIEPDAGEVLWDGRAMKTYDRQAWARRVQMVFQDPYASLNPKLSVGTQLDEALRIAGAGAAAGDLLDRVGLPREAASRYPFQFSGGQRQRIAIARALALQPQLLILDEPLSALDGETQAHILDLFKAMHRDQGLGFLLITHDLGLAAQFAQRVIVLQEGRLVEEGPAGRVLSAPQHAYTRALVEAVIA